MPQRHMPASSRPVVASSNGSRDPLRTPASIRKPPKFILSSQRSSATRFSQTPQFRTPPFGATDEIETDNGGVPSSSRMLSSSRFVSSGHDPIDDIDDDSPSHENTKSRQQGVTDDSDDHTDLVNLEKTRGVRQSNPIPDLLQDSLDDDFSSRPQKRQRISINPTDVINSDADDSDNDGTDVRKVATRTSLRLDSDPEDETEEDDMAISPVIPTSIAPSRFRMPTLTTSSAPHFLAKPIFKPPQIQQNCHGGHTAADSLPDAFSPSRRRGKRDYISGGAAETVRSWVLDLATGHSKHNSAEVETLTISKITKDKDGRCAIVADEEGQLRMLIDLHARRTLGNSDQLPLERITPGNTVLLKEADTRWTIDLEALPPAPDDSVLLPQMRTCSVAVLWDLASR